jgi:choline dehydrogenase-like flavoprotein
VTLEPSSYNCDVVVVGSGFGGSVSKLRLAEKGYRVHVIESGRRPVTVEEPEAEMVEVTAVHRFQIAYAGQVGGPGESLTVPADLAPQWVSGGLATR